MPFIDAKITTKVSDEQKKNIKEKFGAAVRILKKPESYLMVGIEDSYDLWFAGDKMEQGAYVSVQLCASDVPGNSQEMTAEICKILGDELGIPGNRIYVTYQAVKDWGWNGMNF